MIKSIKYNNKSVLSVKINGGTFFSSSQSPLPDDYIQLEGVHFPGDAYFSTDINAAFDYEFNVFLDFMPIQNSTTNMYVFGATGRTGGTSSSLSRAGTLNVYGTNILQVICGGTTCVVYSYTSGHTLMNRRLTYQNVVSSSYSLDQLQTDMVPLVDGNIHMTYNTAQNNYKASPMPNQVFTVGTAQYTSSKAFFIGNIYRFKLSSSEKQILADWYPAQRKSDSAIGFYDTVANKFYTPTVGTVSTIS